MPDMWFTFLAAEISVFNWYHQFMLLGDSGMCVNNLP